MNKTTAPHGETIEIQMADRQIGGVRDAVDERLVSLLCRNARMTLTALAQELALSRTAVQARMARLERDKVIVGYRAIIGRAGGEDEGLGAVLSLTFSQRPCRPVVETFRHWPEITNYYSVTGPDDAFVVVRVDDASALSQLVDRLSATAGVASVRCSVVLKADRT
ncbi:MAG: Lrp/AsnC family transcriptional regulator [Alphaproteobacteria bacterium]|nr:Lrp/AsnC family transcriptional regulator [Alphaproteobacteria bacterium]MBU1514354.1 Lrp/AsnC family transcriptional regulator [Alphaproteobacteria bacterium]MBU2095998.1 Lrp/AsnC family transcriptional regulator [Alphaproteobacteria bacterium]MBU2153096.1 Lrp/AsnC family transcriptional regulator [Alphaproteobacteria bacterium]MBU2308553.1 Lrp/AsnC family transcriptional regulator [Alphaproteobacteria bacterium]